MNTEKAFEPEYKHLLQKDKWELREAIGAILNIFYEYLLTDITLYRKWRNIYDIALCSDEENLKITYREQYRFDPESGELLSEIESIAMVNAVQFINWAFSKGYEIPEILHPLLLRENLQESKEKQISQEGKSPNNIDKRVLIIRDLINIWFGNPKELPDLSRTKIRKTLLTITPDFFSESTFKAAWQKMRDEDKAEKLAADNGKPNYF